MLGEFRFSVPRLAAALAVAALVLSGCDSRDLRAFRAAASAGVEASGPALVEAVVRRDFPLGALLLECGVCTEYTDPLGRTPLGIAVDHGDFDLLAMLINAGADVNAGYGVSGSVLGRAARLGMPAAISALLAAGASGDGRMDDGEPVLTWAIRRDQPGLVVPLLARPVDPQLRDAAGHPLLHVAMQAGRLDIVESLIGRGADVNLRCHDGLTLLEHAFDEGDEARVKFLLGLGADPHARPPSAGRASVFELAFARDDARAFGLVLAHAPPPSGGLEPWLWRAMERRDLAKARLIMGHGGARLAPQVDGLGAVETAARRGAADFVKLFLDYGLPAGRALEHACLAGDHELAGLLLAAGVPACTTRVPTRETPLSLALRGGHDRVAELLVRHGADPELLLPEGQKALHLAIARSCPRTVKAILNQGGDPNQPFLDPVSEDFLNHVRPGVMRWVLRRQQNPTLLMVAVDSGDTRTTRHLLEAGAKTNVRTTGSSLWPINFASRRGDVPMMRLMLGRDPHREDRHIEIRLKEQRAFVFDAEGHEVFATRVSTGRKGYATPQGEFVITNKYRTWTSTIYRASMPYFQRFSCGDFGLHQGVVPGYPASHGCIRIPAGDAARLFAITQTGDRVRIVP